MTVEPDLRPSELPVLPEPGDAPLWLNRNFIFLWLGQVLSQLADKIYLVLVIALTTEFFQPPNQSISPWVSAIMVVFTIPAVLFGSLAGVVVDRWPKKRTLVWTNLGRAGFVALLPLSIWLWPGQMIGFGLLLALTFGISTLTQFFSPAEQSAIPLLVAKEQLLSANSLYTLTMMAAVVVGFAAGEPLLSLASQFGKGGGAILVAASYGGAALGLQCLSPPEQCPLPSLTYAQVWHDLRLGFRLLKKQPLLSNALIQLVVLFSVMAALSVLLIRLAEIIPALDTDQFGFLLAAGAGGLGLGILLLNLVAKQLAYRFWSLIGCFGMAVMLTALGLFYGSLGVSLGLIAGLGFFAALIAIPMQTTLQTLTPEDQRGTIFGLQNNLVNIALTVPLALAGLAETWFGLPKVLWGLAGIIGLGGSLTALRSQRVSRATFETNN